MESFIIFKNEKGSWDQQVEEPQLWRDLEGSVHKQTSLDPKSLIPPQSHGGDFCLQLCIEHPRTQQSKEGKCADRLNSHTGEGPARCGESNYYENKKEGRGRPYRKKI